MEGTINMVDTKEYANENKEYITVEEVTNLKGIEAKQCTIREGAYFKDYAEKTNADGTTMKADKKLIVPVLMGGRNRLLRLNKTVNQSLSSDMNTTETDEWAGATVQLSVVGGGKPYINATLISLPPKGDSSKARTFGFGDVKPKMAGNKNSFGMLDDLNEKMKFGK